MKSKTASEQQTERTARPPSAGARVSTRAVRARKLPKAVLYSRFLTVQYGFEISYSTVPGFADRTGYCTVQLLCRNSYCTLYIVLHVKVVPTVVPYYHVLV